MGNLESKFSLNTGESLIMQKLCDDLNKVLPTCRTTGHYFTRMATYAG